ncbi:hypothetical protein ABMA28_005879 [Loxostege sticticalis]|uniref:Endonuclease-reverse transcriptase n=1 Tax=Loxostege sticticalis TaxID=481309 RepID=A0ABD0SQK9_LOXSC
MEAQLTAFLEKIKEENEIQTKTITENICAKIDEKLRPLQEENEKLKSEVQTLQTKVNILEKEIRKNNLILHKVAETEKSDKELLELVLETLNKLSANADLEKWDVWEISKAHRLGKKGDKIRPILITLTLSWRKLEILRNNKKINSGIFATEDFPKEILTKRRELKEKMEEEIKNGKVAYIRYDKLIVKEATNEKRKRSPTQSPKIMPGGSESIPTRAFNKQPSKKNKVDGFTLMHPNKKQ